MATVTITNISDNTTTSMASGGEIALTLRAFGKRPLYIYASDTVNVTTANAATWSFAWDSAVAFNFGFDRFPRPAGEVFNPAIMLGVDIPADLTGVFYFTITYIGESGLSFARVKVTLVASGNSPSGSIAEPTDWLDPWLIDLRMNLRTRAVTSNYLATAKALKIGDSLPFAVLLSLAGGMISSDVTAIALAIRAPGEFEEEDYLFLTAAGVTLVDVGAGNSYYSLPVTLDSFPLRDWFDALNAKNPPPEGDALLVVKAMAELRVTHSGRVITSETFTLPIRQPVNALV